MRLVRRLRYWLRLRSSHADLLDELAFHREMIERDLVERGMAPSAAATEARRVLGNDTSMREEARGVWLWPSLEAIWQDATYALRDLRRHPAFTVGIVLTLALGIGANAAMFSLIDRLLFRPPALMVDPSTVHRVYLYRTTEEGNESQTGGQYARYRDLAKYSTAFSQSAAFSLKTLAVGTGDETRLRNVAIVSAGFFRFFDAPPVLGRYFTPEEDAPPSPAAVVVLGETVWRTEFGSRHEVLGSTLHVDAGTYTVIGVAPDNFVGLWPYRPPSVFLPVTAYAAARGPRDWATTYGTAIGLGVLVRRKPNVSMAAASADLTNALVRSYEAQRGIGGGSRGFRSLSSLRPRAVAGSVLAERGPDASPATRAATWLSGVTLVVLIIACANVANLLLSRTIRRRREIAVRIALGISRRRLFAQLLTEGLLLAILGGATGVVVAISASGLLSATFLPGTEHVSLITDRRTLLFAAALTLGSGILTALAPMAQAQRASLTNDLKAGAREGTYHRSVLRTSLLLVQSALSVALLVGAGLFVQSLRNVRSVRLGFDADSVLDVSLHMRNVRLDSTAAVALRRRLLQVAQDVPGVAHATFHESTPFDGMSSWPLFVSGIDSMSKLGEFDLNTISADYFATMGTRLVRGRRIESTDTEHSPHVAVVGQSMAAVLWPGQDPIGRCIRVGADTAPCTYVVGVAEDIHSQTIEPEPKLFYYYLAAAQWRPHDVGLFVRPRSDAMRLAEQLRRRLQREMPGTSFVTITRLSDIVDVTLRSWIVGARVFTAFGVLALVLAAVGLYSVIAYGVTQRRHELGVRLALGAARSRIVRLVVMESVRFAAAGIVIGGIFALVGGRWIEPLLFRASPRDPSVFALVTATLLAVALAASLIPALRAASVDPKTALQAD